MARFTLGRSHPLSVYSAARTARQLPWGWRLWGAAVMVTLAGHWQPAVLPLLATVGLLVAWEAMHRHTSSYVVDRSKGIGGWGPFISGLLVACAYLVTSITLTHWQIGGSSAGLAAVILITCAIGFWLTFRMMRHWWEGRFALPAGLVVPTVGSMSIWAAHAYPLPDQFAKTWQGCFPRVAAILLTMGIVQAFRQRRLLRRLRSAQWISAAGESAAFAAIAAFALPVSVGDLQSFSGMAVLTMLIAMFGVSLFRARFEVVKDLAWFSSVLQTGWTKVGPVPIGVFATYAMLPALLLAPIASLPVWLACFTLCVLASVLRLLGPKSKRLLKRVDASKPVGQGRLIAA